MPKKMRNHFAPSSEGLGIDEEKLDMTLAPEFALVR